MHGVEWGKIRRLPQRITYHYCRVLFQAGHQSTRIFGSCWRRSSALNAIPFQSLDLTPGAGNLLGEFYWELISPWRGGASTLNFGASRSVASAFFSLLTSPDRLRRSYYLMYLAKRETAGRRSHRCTDSMQTGS